METAIQQTCYNTTCYSDFSVKFLMGLIILDTLPSCVKELCCCYPRNWPPNTVITF